MRFFGRFGFIWILYKIPKFRMLPLQGETPLSLWRLGCFPPVGYYRTLNQIGIMNFLGKFSTVLNSDDEFVTGASFARELYLPFSAPSSVILVKSSVAGSVLQIVSAPGQQYLRPQGPVVMQTVSQAGTVQNALNALGNQHQAGVPTSTAVTQQGRFCSPKKRL